MTPTTEAIVETLDALGVEYVFGYPGGRTIELLEYVPESDLEFVRPRDEREASVMAETYGRLTGTPGVLTGQGPWIGSLSAMGQMEARLASSPMVVLTEASERGEYSTLAPYQQARGDYGGLSLPKILDAAVDALEDGKAADVPYVVDVRIDREEDMAERLSSSFYDSIGGLHE